MLFHGLALAVVGFYKNATVAHRRLGLGESIQLQRAPPPTVRAKNSYFHRYVMTNVNSVSAVPDINVSPINREYVA